MLCIFNTTIVNNDEKRKTPDLDVPRKNSMRMLCLQLEYVNPDVGCRSCICGGNGDEVAGEVRGILLFYFSSYETSLISVPTR